MRSASAPGFTLTELLIAVSIVGTLAAIAIPSYESYRLKTNRSTGKTCLQQVERSMESYYTRNNRYTDQLADLGLPVADGGVYTCGDSQPLYEVAVSVEESTSLACCYLLTATAVGHQAEDGDLIVRYYSARSQPPDNSNVQPVVVREWVVDSVAKDWN